ncbi:MAG: hypothetical protein CVU03_02380 [Bacteroidetes bacterium HGW-Bacteroidetes-2]|jgi:hypothetical protein|nr:MAG: hypothetical protein CVU13_05935 [Bacteroidetes bacterium HGW-Bacteroidetes-8]PKP26742.1 MAG: hypothetical protein CVU03_02380 [Bacteroidetes bacterium HGW-Bacteroidetes-2]
MKNKVLIYILLAFSLNTFAQDIFEKKFENCDTEKFVMESNTISVKQKTDFVNILATNFDKKTVKEIRGLLSLQVIVNEEGGSCLLSIDNETNIRTEDLNLKMIIDNEVKWYKPKEKTSVILAIKFYGNEVELKRIGLSSEKGFHELID